MIKVARAMIKSALRVSRTTQSIKGTSVPTVTPTPNLAQEDTFKIAMHGITDGTLTAVATLGTEERAVLAMALGTMVGRAPQVARQVVHHLNLGARSQEAALTSLRAYANTRVCVAPVVSL